jgi:hypothetical protein
MSLIDMINLSVNRYDVTFLCLIHENPSSTDKARGHLGTEIMNKASTVIQACFERDLEHKEMDLLKISYLKCRSSKKHEPFFVKYSEADANLILADTETIFSYLQNKKQKAAYLEIIDTLQNMLTEPMQRRELLDTLCDEFNCKERTMEDRIREIMECKAILKDNNLNNCNLVKFKQGKVTFYSLQQIEEEPF